MIRIFLAVAVAFMLCWVAPGEAADISDNGYVEVVSDVYPEPGQSPNDMRRVAVLEAYRYLAEEVDTLHVTSSTTVINTRRVNDEINTSVEAALQGAKVVKVYRDSDGSFHAIARLPVFGGGSLASAVLPKNVPMEDFPKPKFVNIDSGSRYTGLIIDCRGKGLDTAIAPAIKSVSGSKVFAFEQVSRELAVDRGMVAYSSDIRVGVERAGATPLTVTATAISGGCDVVVSDSDADKILAANQMSHFLNNCLVVIVR